MQSKEIYETLKKTFPNAKCDLDYRNPFELVIAVGLSAQTTDVKVNNVTSVLFEKYPDAKALSEANISDVEEIIKSLGLYRNKAKNIVNLSKKLVDDYNGIVPDNMEQLTALDGIGRKSANVILSEIYRIPSLAVDTHVLRVSKRLGITDPEDDVIKTEEKLTAFFDKDKWIEMHHLLVYFGRYMCFAKKPDCGSCPFEGKCYK
ncbi:MAG: endonuclease III [Erysipelotrichaceae bacterium]|nr:endonuclease III [Erysipelotrichaceae bacterium]